MGMNPKTALIFVLVMAMIIPMVGCVGCEPMQIIQPTDLKTDLRDRSIDNVRGIIYDRIYQFWSDNSIKMNELAVSVIQSRYDCVEYDHTTISIKNDTGLTTLSSKDAKNGLEAYYALHSPFFSKICRVEQDTWITSIDVVRFYDVLEKTNDPDLLIQGMLVYGENIANSYDSNYKSYIIVLSNNWLLFYNYQENDVLGL